jgi:hypothetical protein
MRAQPIREREEGLLRPRQISRLILDCSAFRSGQL